MAKRKRPAPDPNLAALRQLVLDRPNDEAAHLIYADALMENGDPLGEVIRWHCAHPDDALPPEQLRAAFGLLGRCAEDLGLVRGIPRYVRLRRVTPTLFGRLVGYPSWESVRSITFLRSRRGWGLPTQSVVALLAHPVCSRVREVVDIHLPGLVHLAQQPLTYDRLVLFDDPPTDYRRVLASPVRLRARALGLASRFRVPHMVRWMMNEGRELLRTAESVSAWCDLPDLLPLFEAELPQLQRISCAGADVWREGGRWHLTVDPLKASGALDSPAVGRALAEFEALLSRYAGVLASVTLAGPDLGSAVASRFERCASAASFSYEWGTSPPSLTPPPPPPRERRRRRAVSSEQ